jgi:hypothetical protein
VVRLAGSRWHGLALYNLMRADTPILSVAWASCDRFRRHKTMTGGVGYLVRRNFRVTCEATRDLTQGWTRWTLGTRSAF